MYNQKLDNIYHFSSFQFIPPHFSIHVPWQHTVKHGITVATVASSACRDQRAAHVEGQRPRQHGSHLDGLGPAGLAPQLRNVLGVEGEQMGILIDELMNDRN